MMTTERQNKFNHRNLRNATLSAQVLLVLQLVYSPNHEKVRQVLVGIRCGAQAQELVHGDGVRVARADVPGGDVHAESGTNL